jgi:hypothetical protein
VLAPARQRRFRLLQRPVHPPGRTELSVIFITEKNGEWYRIEQVLICFD